jgi:hypothetical protein
MLKNEFLEVAYIETQPHNPIQNYICKQQLFLANYSYFCNSFLANSCKNTNLFSK